MPSTTGFAQGAGGGCGSHVDADRDIERKRVDRQAMEAEYRLRLQLMTTIIIMAAAAALLAACGGSVVAPTAPLPGSVPPAAVSSALKTIPITLQVGAFTTSERAAGYAGHLRAQGLDAYHFLDSDGLYKVRFEKFDTEEEARSRGEELVESGIIDAFYIVKPLRLQLPGDPREALRAHLVATAHSFIGRPYVWGGESAAAGFDCSGLTMTVYRLNGLELPRSASDQYQTGEPVAPDDLREGDLVFFATEGGRRVSHVGIYSGRGRFIHAPSSGRRVRSGSLSNDYFSSRFLGARRYF